MIQIKNQQLRHQGDPGLWQSYQRRIKEDHSLYNPYKAMMDAMIAPEDENDGERP